MARRVIRSTQRRGLALLSICLFLAAGVVAATPDRAAAAPGCSITFQGQPWTEGPGVGGFTAQVTITNTGDPINGWTLLFTLPAGQTFTQGWSATWSPGPPVSATNLDWNASLATGASTTIGFSGRWTGSFSNPTSFTLNGTTCGGGPGPGNQAPTVNLTSPTANQSFAAGATIPLAATASDPDGTVNRVEFLIDGNLVGTDTSSPYSFSAPPPAAGNHTAQARAFDNATPAASTTTATVPFTVGAGQTPSISLSPASLTVVEGGSAPLVVRLSAAPPAGTTVNVAVARTGDTSITAAPAQVALTSANWQTGVTVTVSAAEDADQVDGTATIGATATGYTGASAAVTEDDNDGGPSGKVDNPFAGATGYVNSAWQANVNNAADTAGNATLAAQMRVVGRQPTAVWMDRIGAIDPPGATLGLADHLNAAVQQDAANGSSALAIQVVVYDLPNRDCAALASNGELLISQNGLARYRTEYIDPIRAVLSNPAYANLRIVLIVEPDSLPNLVTNVSGPQASQRCIEARDTGAYRDGVRYAVGQLSSLANTYLYLDIAHSGWLGWPNNFDGTLSVFDQTIAAGQGGPGYDKLHGFITNTANYTPLEEVFLPNPNLQVGSGQVMSATFYEFNPRFDERDFATDLQAAFAARGCVNCGMLVDTSRNGWGGPNRPTAVSTSTDLNTYVNQSRIDRRPHRGGWCNQNGAGIGVRPTASTGIAGVDAFVWVKPPGESDGVSEPGIVDPEDPAKGFDAMCDPEATNRYNPAFSTNALPDAPHAGRWFLAQFRMLVQNAFPVLPTS